MTGFSQNTCYAMIGKSPIGGEGIEKIFNHSVNLHGPMAKSKIVLSDTTV